MAKEFFKKLAPDPDKIKNHKSLRLISHLFQNPNLWYFNRHSVAKACAIGFFCAFLPIPCQMLLAAVLAIVFLANLSLSVILVWIVNPITMGPIFYLNYKLGLYTIETLGFASVYHTEFNWNVTVIYEKFLTIWKPLWVGSLIVSTLFAFIGYYGTKILWSLAIIRKRKKKNKMLARIKKT